MKTIDKVSQEIQTAKEKYGPFNSTHEVYGVLIEEVAEFFDEVRKKTYARDVFENENFEDIEVITLEKKQKIKHELLQIAAISLRAIDELEHNQIRWV
jgi:hypothetical protein